jgi:hypothetical protein
MNVSNAPEDKQTNDTNGGKLSWLLKNLLILGERISPHLGIRKKSDQREEGLTLFTGLGLTTSSLGSEDCIRIKAVAESTSAS